MNDFIKFTGPADVLAFIPHTLGQNPTESFVALTLQGNKIGATLRVDAPFGQDPVGYAQTIVSYLTADEAATGSLLVIYTDESTIDGSARWLMAEEKAPFCPDSSESISMKPVTCGK